MVSRVGPEDGVHAVDDQRVHLEACALEAVCEPARFCDGVESRCRDEHECGRAVSEQLTNMTARSLKPSSMPAKAWKNATASLTMSAPATLEIVLRNA